MEIVLLIVGLLVGVLLGFLLAKNKSQAASVDTNNKLAEAEARLNQEKNTSSILQKTIDKLELSLGELRDKLQQSEVEKAQKSTQLIELQKRFESFKEEAKDLQTHFKNEFKNLSNEIIKEQSKDFNEHNINLLKPFKNQLESFEKAVNNQMKDNIERSTTFNAQINHLKELNQQISQEAKDLTNALKGDNKLQGNWGELILERVLQSSGLVKGDEYTTQTSFVNADEKTIRPDAVIFLPDDKHIIIDSKVSLTAYERYVNTTNEVEKAEHLKGHLNSLRNHVKGLSEKKYQTAQGLSTPDFILLFVPIEASFGVAIKEDVELFNFGWDKNIVIVSPSTLLATLKTVSALWKQEKQTKNVLKIAEESGKLYDKFVGFVTDLEKIEKDFERTSKSFSDAHKKLTSGRGSIVSKIENLKKLGAKTTKSIDEKYLED